MSLAQLASLAAIAQTAVIIVAAFYALGQVREARKAREAMIIMSVFDRLHSLDASNKRHHLYNEVAAAWPDLSHEQEAIVRETVNQFDLLAYLVVQELVPFRTVAGLYYGTVLRVWEAAKPYILDQRARRGTRYAQYFERLVEDSRRYMAESRPTEHPRELRPEGSDPMSDTTA